MSDEYETRHAARLAAVQALYQMEIAGIDADSVTEEFSLHRFGREPEIVPSEADEAFFADLVHGVPARQGEIDEAIAANLAENWRFSRVDSLLRALLRAGVYELIGRSDVPAKVIIDEYVGLTHAFYNDNEAPFVNAMMDKIARLKRASEFGLPPPEGTF